MKVWLDDIDPMPIEYDIHVFTAKEAIELLESKQVVLISLDHDLGEPEDEKGNGYQVACWIEKNAYFGKLPKLDWKIHSDNPVGISKMRSALANAERYWKEGRSTDS